MFNFVADTAIEGLFIASIESADVIQLEKARRSRLNQMSTASSSSSVGEPLAVQILMRLVRNDIFHSSSLAFRS